MSDINHSAKSLLKHVKPFNLEVKKAFNFVSSECVQKENNSAANWEKSKQLCLAVVTVHS